MQTITERRKSRRMAYVNPERISGQRVVVVGTTPPFALPFAQRLGILKREARNRKESGHLSLQQDEPGSIVTARCIEEGGSSWKRFITGAGQFSVSIIGDWTTRLSSTANTVTITPKQVLGSR